MIAEIAKKYIGQTEKPNNMGFNNAEFEKKMKAVGFAPSQSWCAYFTELVWKEAMPNLVAELDKLFSASATQTLKNFQAAGYTISKTPQLGALAVWQYGSSWKGHIGIVSQLRSETMFMAIEGNTNDKGGREGYIVAERARMLNAKHTESGLNLLGFIIPKA